MSRESTCTLTSAELSDPEFVRTYIESHLDSFDCAMRELARLRMTLNIAKPLVHAAPGETMGKAPDEFALAGYKIACKFGVLEGRGFKLADEMYSALVTNMPAPVEVQFQARLVGDGWVEVNRLQYDHYLASGTPVRTLRCYLESDDGDDAKMPGSFTNAEDLFVAMGVGDFVWTSAKDKMPSGPGLFLVTDAANELTPWVHRFTAQGKFYGHRDITHWMPLPAPPIPNT